MRRSRHRSRCRCGGRLTGDDRLLEAHDVAVTAALDASGAVRVDDRIRRDGGRLHPDTDGLTMATFRQTTSRADDPQIHTHTVISAKVQTADGRWWALDARYLKRHQRMLGGLYQSVLRNELTHRFGVEWAPIVNGQAEIAGFPTELFAVFSKRAADIERALDVKLDEFAPRRRPPPSGRAPSNSSRSPCRLTRSPTWPGPGHRPRRRTPCPGSRSWPPAPAPSRPHVPGAAPLALAVVAPLTVPGRASAGLFTPERARGVDRADRPARLASSTRSRSGRWRSASTRASSPRSACWARRPGVARPRGCERLAEPAERDVPARLRRRGCRRAGAARPARAAGTDVVLRRARPGELRRRRRRRRRPATAATRRRRADAADAEHRPPTPGGSCRPPRQLLAWPYTRTDIAWPADDTIATGDLGYLDAAGLTTAILAPGNVEPIDGCVDAVVDHRRVDRRRRRRPAHGAAARGVRGLDRHRMALRRPGELLAELALDAGEAAHDRARDVRSRRRTRRPTGSPTRSIDVIGERAGRARRPLRRDRRATVDAHARRRARGRPATHDGRAHGRRPRRTSPSSRRCSTTPRLLTGPDAPRAARRCSTWPGSPTPRRGTPRSPTGSPQRRRPSAAVSVVPSSTINVVSTRDRRARRPSLNALPYPVTVVVDVDPSNGRLIVEDRVEVTVEPESRATVRGARRGGRRQRRGHARGLALLAPTGVPDRRPRR